MCYLYCGAVQMGGACVCHLLNSTRCSCMDYTLYGTWLYAFACQSTSQYG